MMIQDTKLETVSKPVIFKRYFSFRRLLVLNLAAFSILTFFAKTNPYFPFDLVITRAIQSLNNSFFDSLMKFLTAMGDPIFYIGSVFLVGLFLLSVKKSKESLILFISTFGVSILTGLIKVAVSRPRPDPTLILQYKSLYDPSFPSGHVLFAIAFYGLILFLAFSHLKKSFLRNLIIFVCSLIILLMPISRVYLGVHWFSDILGSFLIGSVWLYLMISLYRRIIEK